MKEQEQPISKEQLIEKENDRLLELFAGADPNKLDFIREQVKQLAFFNVSIAELQDKINQWGTLIQYDNGGGQTGVKANPDVKTLTDYQKLSNSIIRALIPIVPQKISSFSKLASFLVDDLEETT